MIIQPETILAADNYKSNLAMIDDEWLSATASKLTVEKPCEKNSEPGETTTNLITNAHTPKDGNSSWSKPFQACKLEQGPSAPTSAQMHVGFINNEVHQFTLAATHVQADQRSVETRHQMNKTQGLSHHIQHILRITKKNNPPPKKRNVVQ